jgi:hypothetical protein
MWSGFGWCRMGTSGGILRTLRGISWLAQRLLACREGLCTVELASYENTIPYTCNWYRKRYLLCYNFCFHFPAY